MEEQKYFELPQESIELRKQLEQLTLAYDQLGNDYREKKQKIIHHEALITQLTREKAEAEKQLNDFIIHMRDKMDQVKNIVIEIPQKTLYGLALDWQQPAASDSVFVTVNEDGEVNLRTREEMKQIKAAAEDPEWKPPYRHWWLTEVCDVKSVIS